MKTKNKRKLALMILFIMVLQVILPLCSINTNVVEAADINEEQMVIDLYNALEKIETKDSFKNNVENYQEKECMKTVSNDVGHTIRFIGYI